MSTERALRWVIFLGGTALVLYLCLRLLQPLLGVMAWAVVLATIFHPFHERLSARTGRPILSGALTSVLVMLLVVGPLASIAAVAVDQLLELRSTAQQLLTPTEPGAPATAPAAEAVGWVARYFQFDLQALIAWATEHASELAQAMAQYTFSIAAGITSAVVSFVFVIFAVFLLLVEGNRLRRGITDVLPFEPARSEALMTRIADVIYAGVYGIIVIALLQGVLAGVMFWMLGIPSAALWGLVTAAASVLPLIGSAIVWVPGTAYLALTGHWTLAIILAVWGAAVISSVDNFLRPKLVGDRVGLSEFVTFFALLGGVQYFGFLGIVLGPVLFAILAAVIDVLKERTPAA